MYDSVKLTLVGYSLHSWEHHLLQANLRQLVGMVEFKAGKRNITFASGHLLMICASSGTRVLRNFDRLIPY